MAGAIIEGHVTYFPDLTPLPINLTCNTTGTVIAWNVNNSDYTVGNLAMGGLPGHNATGTNILVNHPANDTQYICVFLANGEIRSDPVYVYVAGECDIVKQV